MIGIKGCVGHHAQRWSWRVWMLGVLGWLATSGLPAARAQQATEGERLTAEYIPGDAMGAVFVQPSAIMSSPEMRMLPIEVASAWSKQSFGMDLADVDEIQVVVGAPGPMGPQLGMVFRLSKPFDLAKSKGDMIGETPAEIDGFTVYPIAEMPDMVAHQVDPQTVVVAMPSYLSGMLASKQSSGPLADLVDGMRRIHNVMVVIASEPIREMAQMVARQAPPQVPPVLLDLFEIVELSEGMVLATDAGLQSRMVFVMLGNDEADAGEIEGIVNRGLLFARDMAVGQSIQSVEGTGPVPDALRQYMQRMGEEFTAMLKPKRSGRRLVLEIENPGAYMMPAMSVGLLLPAVQAARSSARRMTSMNNVKQMLLAFHNYHDVYGRLPGDITDEDGNPLLSWRVAILPFVEEQRLYQEFHLDEPWDSEHNIRLLERMPPLYEPIWLELPPTLTVYHVPDGKGMIFENEQSRRFGRVFDGLSNTIAIFEASAAEAVPWTRPGGVGLDQVRPLDKMGSERPGGEFVVGFADGSVSTIVRTIDPQIFWALLTSQGGEAVDRTQF